MRRARLAFFLLVAAVPGSVAGQAQRDPHLQWRTIRTEHFAIHYHEPLGMIARRVAAVAERAHAILAPALRRYPEERTEIVLTDDTDSANGSAGATPYNHIRLFASGPEDLTPLSDYDDWLTELVTHEHTHVLHLDTISGIPALINAILGKVYPPNSVQPRWFVEGFAVYEESEHTAGGRLRSTMFDMFMRMDALSDRVLTLAEMSNGVDRWPHGNVPYLYGSRFVEHIAETYGQEALTQISHEYGGQLIPYGLNRVARRATGKGYDELYAEYVAELRRESEAVAAEVRARGVVEGTRITFHGENARCPRFLDEERVAYWVAALDHSQIASLDAETGEDVDEIGRSTGVTCLSVAPGGRYLYHGSLESHRNIYFFYDLFRLDRRSGRRERLTHGMRAQEPDVSPDGRRIVFTVNGAATTHLAIADARDIEETHRILVRSDRYEQIYTPRWSPDGRTVAYSTWQDGGYRDIHLVDVASGRVVEVTHDRALDTGPSWSPDGRTLYFSSDRTGIANIYAFDTVSGHTMQVTNVIGGAFQPAISPSGRRMVYLGYTSWGWDLYTLELDPTTFRPAPAYADTRPVPTDTESVTLAPSEEYDPLETILPRAYMLELGENAFGTAIGITFSAGDVVGLHTYGGRIGVGLERGEINAELNYTYQKLITPVSLRLFRSVSPRGGLIVGGEPRTWIEEAWGGEVSLFYPMPRMLHGESLSLRYGLAHIEQAEPFGGRLDPNDPPPTLPERGRLSSIGASWSWSDVVGTAFDISPSEGRTLGLGMSVAHPYIGSQFTAVSASWSVTQYVENPFVQHHVLAMRYAGGMSGGDLGRRGAFSLGGFPEGDVLQQVLDVIVFGGVALRGYPPGFRRGTQFHLLQTEYRFPLARFMWGVSTLPAYLTRMWGSVFFDVGDAFFGKLRPGELRTGVGGELHIDFQLGYALAYSLRVGLARGLGEGGGTHFYTHIGVPF